MDWWQLLYSFIGAFLGFGFALLTEELVNKAKNKNEKKELQSNLMDELKSIADNLRNNETKNVPIYFEVPIWHAIISTGMLLSLLKDNKKMYDMIILIYNRVFALKEMEKDINKNCSNIYILRHEIVSKIDDIMK